MVNFSIPSSIISKAKVVAKIEEIGNFDYIDDLVIYCKDILVEYKWAKKLSKDQIDELSVIMAHMVSEYREYGVDQALFQGQFDDHILNATLHKEELSEWAEIIWKLIGQQTESDYHPTEIV